MSQHLEVISHANNPSMYLSPLTDVSLNKMKNRCKTMGFIWLKVTNISVMTKILLHMSEISIDEWVMLSDVSIWENIKYYFVYKFIVFYLTKFILLHSAKALFCYNRLSFSLCTILPILSSWLLALLNSAIFLLMFCFLDLSISDRRMMKSQL